MIGNIYKLENATTSINSGVSPMTMPYPLSGDINKEGQEGHKYEDFFLQNLFYIMSFYDQPNNTISFPFEWNNGNGGSNSGVSLDESQISWWSQPSSQMFLNYAYYMQRQPNLNANHLTKNVNSTNSHAVWARGGRIASIIDKMCGVFQEQLQDIKFSAEPISPGAKSVKEKKIEKEEFLFLLKPVWEKYMQGLASMPQQAKPFEMPQDIQEWADTGIKDFLADVYLNITVDNWEKQYWIDDSQKIFRDASICDCTGVEHIVERGYYKKIVHPPYNLIVDNRFDDPFGRWRRFSGVIENLTLTEVYYRYTQLDDKDRKTLYDIAISRDSMNGFNSFPNIMWWNAPSDYNGTNWQDVTVTVVRCYWIAPEEIDGEIMQTVYTGELLGNRYLLNYGKCDNIVENPYNPYMPILPLQIFTPNMLLGTYNSFVTKVRTLQDDYDRLRFKQMEMIGKADGMVTVLNGEHFGQEQQVVDVYKDWKKYGVTMTSQSGQANNPSDGRPIGYQFDKRLDPSFGVLSDFRDRINKEIEMYVGQTPITLGEQSRYIGKEAYNNGQEAGASGTFNFYENCLKFIQINMDIGINIKKNLYADGQLEEEAGSVIGEKGIRILKETKDKFTRDFGIWLKINDKISSDKKKDLFEIVKAYALNPNDGYTAEDLIKIYTASTWTKLIDNVKTIDKRIAKEKSDRAQEQQQMEQDKMQHEKEMAALLESNKNNMNESRLKRKDDALETKREEKGLPPLQDEIPQQQQPQGAQTPNAPQGQPPAQSPQQNIPQPPQQ